MVGKAEIGKITLHPIWLCLGVILAMEESGHHAGRTVRILFTEVSRLIIETA